MSTTPKNAYINLTLSTLNAIYQIQHAGIGLYQCIDKSVKSFQYLKDGILVNGMHNLFYNGIDRSICLFPDLFNKQNFKDMTADEWESPYNLYVCEPLDPDVTGLCFSNGHINADTLGMEFYTVTSKNSVAANSSFVYSHWLAEEAYLTYDQMTENDVFFSHSITIGKTNVEGSGYILEISATKNPVFYGEYDSTLGKRPILGQYKWTDEERQEYWKGGLSRFGIYYINGEVVVLSTAWSDRWVITGINNIPAGKMEVSIMGINTVFNMSNITFSTSGYFISDWINIIDCDYPIPYDDAEDYADNRFVYYPQNNPNGNIKFRIYASEYDNDNDGNTIKNRIKIICTMTGDGVSSPFLRGWQFINHPIFRTVNDPPLNINDFVGSAVMDKFVESGNFTMNTDIVTDNFSITLQNHNNQAINAIQDVFYEKQEWDDPDLPEFTSVLLYGNVLAIVYYGYEQYVDGVREVLQENSFIGYIPSSQISSALNSEKITFNIKSLAYPCMQSTLYYAPCLTGFAIVDAIALMALWGGIAPEKICIHEKAPVYEVSNFTNIMNNVNGIVYLDVAPSMRTLFLMGDEFNLESPMWLNNNQKVWEVIAKLCDRYGYSVWEDGAIFNIQRTQDRFPLANNTNLYNYDLKWEDIPGKTSVGAIRNLEISPIDNDIANVVVGEGRDKNDKILLVSCSYKDSISKISSRRYVGYKISFRLQDNELMTIEDLSRAVRNYSVIHQPGKVNISAEGFYGNLFGLVPGNLIQIAANYPQMMDANLNDPNPPADTIWFYFFRIRSITYDSPAAMPHWTCKIDAEYVDIANPWAFNMIGAKSSLSGVRNIINAMRPIKARLQDDFDGQVKIIHPDWQFFTCGLSLCGGADKIRPDGV